MCRRLTGPRGKGGCTKQGKGHVVGAQMVFNAIAGRGSAKKLEASQPIETHGLVEGLLDPASNWVALLDCLLAPHFLWGLKSNLLTRVVVSSCAQLHDHHCITAQKPDLGSDQASFYCYCFETRSQHVAEVDLVLVMKLRLALNSDLLAPVLAFDEIPLPNPPHPDFLKQGFSV